MAAVLLFDPDDAGACVAALRWLAGPDTPVQLVVVVTPCPVDPPRARGGMVLRSVVAQASQITALARVLAELLNARSGPGRPRVVSPRRGFHVVVPLEYRAAGAPPAEWFIDDLMRHLRRAAEPADAAEGRGEHP